jgi:protocatechuate 3,4-dioxygenase, beta subunit
LSHSPKILAYNRPAPGAHPEYLHPAYKSSVKRAPTQPLIHLPHTLSEVTVPSFSEKQTHPLLNDLTHQPSGDALGERIIVSGRVLDENSRPIPHTLVELWQANSAGRYFHKIDQHDAPLDPNFPGVGHTVTDSEGRYKFLTIRPGAYPWKNHHNAWRPAHIHFSVFGPAFATRLVTQMYFPGDPLLPFDPIFNSTPDEAARNRLISLFDWDSTTPDHALGYKFDIILRGRNSTPVEP